MSRIFIDRPIFAWVIAIIIMLAGVGAIFSLPVAQYPDIAPPQVNIRASYPGASAETLENSVTQVIEQQLTGIDGLLYFSSIVELARLRSRSPSTFDKGTDPDIAQVQVQNKVQQALSRLPQQVQQQGLTRHQVEPRLPADRRRLRHDRPAARTSDVSRLSRRPTCRTRSARIPGRRRHQRVRRRNMRCGSGSIPHKLAELSADARATSSPRSRRRTPRSRRARSAASRSRDDQMLNATVTAQSRLSDARAVRATSSSRPQPDGVDACCSATSRGSSSAPRATPRSAASTAIPAPASRVSSRPAPTR